MPDLTLEDLANSESTESDAETAKSGESLLELVEFLDTKGYLQPLMFGIDNTPDADAPTAERTTDEGVVELNAENVAQLADMILESRVGDVPISKIGQFAKQNPEKVNQLIDNL